jgi:hypothetical protein
VGLLDPDRFSAVSGGNRNSLLGEVLRFISGRSLVGVRRVNTCDGDFHR